MLHTPFINYSPPTNYSLIYAAKINDFAAIQSQLNTPGTSVNGRDASYGYTALDWAARNGNTEIMSQLLIAGAHPNVKRGTKHFVVGFGLINLSSWELAREYNHIREFAQAFQTFLAHRNFPTSTVRAIFPWLGDLLLSAAQNNDLASVHALLAISGIPVNARCSLTEATALHFAAARGDTEMMIALFRAGADPEALANDLTHQIRFCYDGPLNMNLTVREFAEQKGQLEAYDAAWSAYQQSIAPSSSSSSYEPIAMRTRSQTAKRSLPEGAETSCSSDTKRHRP